MAKHRTKITAAAAIILLLAAAWFFGGSYGKGGGDTAAPPAALAVTAEAEAPPETANGAAVQAPPGTPSQTPAASPAPSDGADAAPPSALSGAPTRPASPPPSQTADGTPSPAPSDTPEPPPGGQAMVIDPETGKDKYLTDPVPEGKPLPVEPQDAVAGDGSFTVTLSVRCDTILNNMDLLNKEKHELVPADGVIFPASDVTVYEGESVFNVLRREMKRAKIHMEFVNTPIYNSAYIEGIHNLYEFDTGELSGWMYKVNGWFPNYGCSRYQLKAGDLVEWEYTCDLGDDVGGGYSTGDGQKDE